MTQLRAEHRRWQEWFQHAVVSVRAFTLYAGPLIFIDETCQAGLCFALPPRPANDP